MSDRMVHAVMTKEAYEAVMDIVANGLAEHETGEYHEVREESWEIASGFFKGYGIHAADCCDAFDRLLANDGYEKKGGVSNAE